MLNQRWEENALNAEMMQERAEETSAAQKLISRRAAQATGLYCQINTFQCGNEFVSDQ